MVKLTLIPLMASLLTITAHADSEHFRTINSLTFERSGGGSHTVVITKKPSGEFSGITTACNFADLSKTDQQKTRFVLTGDAAKMAQKIFDGQAILAE